MNYASIIKKQSTIIAVSVFVMVIGIIGTSYALFMKVDQSEEQTVQSGSLVMQLSPYDGSTVISSNNTPIGDNEGMLTKGYSFSVTNNGTLPITYYIALYNNPDDTSTKLDYKYIKVSLDNGTPFLLSSITSKDSSGRSILKQGISLAPNKYDTHNIKVWIDEDTPESEIGKSLSLKIYAYGEVCEEGECSGGTKIPEPANTTISNLAKTDTVNLATDDADKNVRYIGKDPSNYVYFNCSDYNNPTADTCELWRIIGVFNNVTKSDGSKENLVKIIRADSLGNYFWDYKKKGVGTSTDDGGSNDWTDSQLMMMLNPTNYLKSGYTNSSDIISSGNQQLYSKMGSYYNGTKGCKPAAVASGASFSCTEVDFTSTGLKNDTTRNAIEEVVWNLGGTSSFTSSSNGLASHWYGYEKGTTVYTGRPTTWTGKVGLMYPSDYGYATSGGTTKDRAACLAKELYNWNSSDFSDCKGNEYLLDANSVQWTLAPYSAFADSVFLVVEDGHVSSSGASTPLAVRPALFLKSSILLDKGTGESSNPYTLKMQ